ncbi:leucine-rich repeat domain-containing protein [Treponema sp. Marseille-Q4130]|uniref:leucine-rich repeat domain-containing protein n=1 Tax=Treponema sp. Marseille-Q4130 TaxID=2766702 RepID=UPI001651BB22|nr:leucine-rich repeat domain-containing protein [Treponema sp. Marseille-Q4130]MBC6719540.1 leucine-rich repeat domain-containing protein [Treponema sp. Marseille-Q4130]
MKHLSNKKGAAALATAAVLAFALLFTGCSQTTDGSFGGGSGSGGGIGGSAPQAPLVSGGASLILSPNELTITVTVKTADNSPVTVEGCTETKLTINNWETKLHAKGTTVILKGNIIELKCGIAADGNSNKLLALNVQGLSTLQELDCSSNRLTALDVQGCTALKKLHCYNNQLTSLNVQGLHDLQDLWCSGNRLTELNVQDLSALQELLCYGNRLTSLNVQGLSKLDTLRCRVNRLTELNVQGCIALRSLDCTGNRLNTQAFIKIFNDLPQIPASYVYSVLCYLYTEKTGVPEGNLKDFSAPSELKAAFDNAKAKKWAMYKYDASGNTVKL